MDFIINVTDSAIKRITHLSSLEEGKNRFLRISVESGGCSGLQYKYEFEGTIEDGDAKVSLGEVTILVDNISQEFLHNSTLDYVQTLGNAYFEVRNPKATAKCGCGNSFAV